jgi:hypothetical protein
MSDKPGSQEAAEALAAALRGEAPAIVCYAKCGPCMYGCHYDEPTPHPWAGDEDIEHARATGQPEPTGICGCSCARVQGEAS